MSDIDPLDVIRRKLDRLPSGADAYEAKEAVRELEDRLPDDDEDGPPQRRHRLRLDAEYRCNDDMNRETYKAALSEYLEDSDDG